ncbi:DUF3995 domain-containing protein [Streptomyces sp. NPDC050560]|uniref:DUF3995 domain-containing protein n=1 Tax=Streptomyces sp. NPDC050560 TaxID=3365630 RepID=UPI0037B06B5E
MTALDEKTPVRPGDGTDLAVRPRLVLLTVVFTLLYAGVHVYWAVGGTWRVPVAARQDPGTVRAANWVVTAAMLVGAAWVPALNHRAAGRVPAWALLVPLWCGGVVCVSHAVFGFVTKTLYLLGAHGAVDFPAAHGVDPAALAHDHRLSAVRDLWLFEACFLVQGVLPALAARQFVPTPAGRRGWSRSFVLGVAAVDAFGLLLSLGNTHVALG